MLKQTNENGQNRITKNNNFKQDTFDTGAKKRLSHVASMQEIEKSENEHNSDIDAMVATENNEIEFIEVEQNGSIMNAYDQCELKIYYFVSFVSIC